MVKMRMIMFQGRYNISLDNKNRLTVPSIIRRMIVPEAEDTLVFVRGFDNINLDAYPMNEWEKLIADMSYLDAHEKDSRSFVREFIGSAFILQLDNQGRLILPDSLLELAGIDKDILVIGAINKLEIWNPKIYTEFRQGDNSDLSELSKRVKALAELKAAEKAKVSN
jgi:MraZ protein